MKRDRHMIKDSNPSAEFIQSTFLIERAFHAWPSRLACEFMACETAVRSLAAGVKRFEGR